MRKSINKYDNILAKGQNIALNLTQSLQKIENLFMEQKFDILARNLSTHILDLRKKRGITQLQLAQMADIPRSTIANLESGMGNPSLQNLVKICGALQVPIQELLATPRSPVTVIRKEEIPVSKRSRGSVSVFNLLPDPIDNMSIERMELEPNARMGGVPHFTGTKEYFHCVQGNVAVVVTGKTYELKPGDVIAFPGDAAHAYINLSSSKALGFSVVVMAPNL